MVAWCDWRLEMPLSKDEWLEAIVEQNAKMNAIGLMVRALNQFHDACRLFDRTMEFVTDDSGQLVVILDGTQL
jgi:hypothetical protein